MTAVAPHRGGAPRRAGGAPAGSRQRILDAALLLLARHGYDGMSLQQIADEVGLHKATLFHHFTGKRELALEVWESVITPLLEYVRPLELERGTVPELEQLVGVAERLVDHFAERPAAARFLVRDLVAPEDSPFHVDPEDADHPVVRLFTILWNWLERARRAGVVRDVNLRQVLFNLLGVMLFYPASAGELAPIAGPDPFSPNARRAWKRELTAFLRGALAPE
jgi:AcrR family transcriptional regulator